MKITLRRATFQAVSYHQLGTSKNLFALPMI
jgi:hypothetical protein